MTRTANARLAGVTYFVYMAAGICNEVVMKRAVVGDGNAAKLASIAKHVTDVRVGVLLMLLECMSAVVLAVALYGITRGQDHELAMLGLVCRVAEGVIDSFAIPSYLGLVWLAKAGTGAGAPDAATANALSAFLLIPVPSIPVGTIFFAVGSGIFSCLLLRGRMVPVPIAWLGVVASALLVAGLPLRLAGFYTGPLTGYPLWLPALVFQIALALWLLVRGVAGVAGANGANGAATPAAR